MRFRKWFLKTIDTGAPADPDERVTLVVVSGPTGPMTVARLQADGFDAFGYEIGNLRGASSYEIFVPRHQLPAASERVKSII